MERRYRKVAAVIVAAGKGRRMGLPRAKAFIPLRGTPIIVHAIQAFEACGRIQGIYPVLRKEDIRFWHQEILKKFPFKKTKPPVAGGLSRQESVRIGLESIREAVGIVLIHDGVRPFVDVSMLEQLLDKMEEAQAAVLAVPAKETMKIVSSGGRVLETPARETLWHIQTPQAFDFRMILEAHHKAMADGIVATDDSALVERMGIPVAVVQGSYKNIKITTSEDLIIAQALFGDREQTPVEF